MPLERRVGGLGGWGCRCGLTAPCHHLESCNERHSGWDDVGSGCICGQEVAGGPGVKDGPIFDGNGICQDCFEEDGGCKCIVLGGDRART